MHAPVAWAWNHHQGLMPLALQLAPTDWNLFLDQKHRTLCPDQEIPLLLEIAKKLHLNPKTKFLPTTDCKSHPWLTVREVLLDRFVDEPDLGMDQDLSDAEDPQQDRPYMGGSFGPTSQGFRHMYFGGWSIAHPWTTFQIPVHRLGQAPSRITLILEQSQSLFVKGHPLLGARLLAWAIHYVQDLAQPFHAVQIPSFKIIPWTALWHWPPQKGFQLLVQGSTRTVANYHWALEEYTTSQLQHLNPCITQKMTTTPETRTPSQVVDRSIQIASQIGHGVYEFFGPELMAPSADLAHGVGKPDYQQLAASPLRAKAKNTFEASLCVALDNAMRGTLGALETIERLSLKPTGN